MKHIIAGFFLLSTLLIIGQDFEVAPVVINFDANPGEIQKQMVTIRNHANIKQAFSFNLGDFEVDSQGKKVRMPAGTSKRSCADWITINPSFIELNPNEEKKVAVIMTVPEDGMTSRWAMIYVQATTEQKENPVDKKLATGIKLTPRIAILVNQSPKANSNYAAKIHSLKEVTQTGDSLRSFEATVENIGEKIIKAKVHLELGNMSTGKEQRFPGKNQRVYPGEKRKFVLTLPNNIASGQYAVLALLDYGHGTSLEGTQLMIDFK